MNDVLAIELALVIVVPVIAGLAVLWFFRRTSPGSARLAVTAVILYIELRRRLRLGLS